MTAGWPFETGFSLFRGGFQELEIIFIFAQEIFKAVNF